MVCSNRRCEIEERGLRGGGLKGPDGRKGQEGQTRMTERDERENRMDSGKIQKGLRYGG